ncbi:hypothetical protein ACRASX_00115 [Flavobacterium sp. TMP13]|uniref:hypothetical protein n=1 Tax=unclassified Flavobacterium TaxID=196869 RepID=UPI00076C9971|nr:hypothetical protein [Flavobacterium sp. TAB 87]KVV15630.1 hypothetical protein AP058_00914 [Flavobacterium sp. TAB 87]
MYLIHAKYLIPKGYRGMTIFPFVLLKNQEDKTNMIFITHEKIHLKQQLELLIVPFFIWYFIEFIFRCVQYKNVHLGYRNISFEREAYHNETHLLYLKNRKAFAFLKYLKND